MVEPILNLKKKILPPDDGTSIKIRKAEEKLNVKEKDFVLAWDIPPYHEATNAGRLRLIAAFIFIAALVIMFTLKEYTFSAFLMIIAVTAVILRNKNPGVRHIKIHHYGITINNRLHPFRELKSFYVTYEPRGLKELSLQSKIWYLPIIRVSIEPGNSPLVIRNHLIEYLPEVEHPLSAVDEIINRLGI